MMLAYAPRYLDQKVKERHKTRLPHLRSGSERYLRYYCQAVNNGAMTASAVESNLGPAVAKEGRTEREQCFLSFESLLNH